MFLLKTFAIIRNNKTTIATLLKKFFIQLNDSCFFFCCKLNNFSLSILTICCEPDANKLPETMRIFVVVVHFEIIIEVVSILKSSSIPFKIFCFNIIANASTKSSTTNTCDVCLHYPHLQEQPCALFLKQQERGFW